MNTSLQTAVLLPFESILNRCLEADQHSQRLLAAYEGKILEIESRMPTLTLYVVFLANGVRLCSVNEEKVDGKVSAKASELLKILLDKPTETPLTARGLEVSGDSFFVQEIYRIFSDMEINWQELFSLVLGHAATGQLESSIRRLGQWSRHVVSAVRNSVDEYIHEEARVSPSATEVESFALRLDAMRLQLDRLEARKRQLENRLAGD
ncbi:MAG: SCP2 sterol-binding domain-containing protein [Pseudohongiellaceae bacterium]